MAVEQSQSWVISDKIHGDLLVPSDHDYVFHDAGSRGSRQTGQLEAVPVEMYRMDVIAGIAHVDSIPVAFLQVKRGRSHCIGHRIGCPVDGPAVEALFSGIVFPEDHLEGIVWCWRTGSP